MDFRKEGNLELVITFVQRERDNLVNRPAVKFAYSLVRNGLYSFIEIRTLGRTFVKYKKIKV
ncbi:hypothetical protein DBR40_25050 [Pedobacter sp. KBW01]|nr:hypothetical protein DBR40_25050 [Pedobacter sp. KBW01]